MKKKKYRILSLLLALCLLLSVQPVFAGDGSDPIVTPTPIPTPAEYPSKADGSADGHAEVSVTLNASPSYTLVIPPYIKAGNNGMIYQYDEDGRTIPFEISIKNCKTFESGLYRIAVTVTGSGGKNNDEFLLEGDGGGGNMYQLAYSLYKEESAGSFTEVKPHGEFASFLHPFNEEESKAAGKVVLANPENLPVNSSMTLTGYLYFHAEVVNKGAIS